MLLVNSYFLFVSSSSSYITIKKPYFTIKKNTALKKRIIRWNYIIDTRITSFFSLFVYIFNSFGKKNTLTHTESIFLTLLIQLFSYIIIILSQFIFIFFCILSDRISRSYIYIYSRRKKQARRTKKKLKKNMKKNEYLYFFRNLFILKKIFFLRVYFFYPKKKRRKRE